jgi:putative ABC transport system substrate-binding protein
VKRRTFIAGIGGAAAWPLVVQAQQPAMPVIGFLSTQSADDSKNFTVALLRSLKESGSTRCPRSSHPVSTPWPAA